MNKLAKIILVLIFALGLWVSPALAVTDTVSISDLSEYTRTDNFYLSYSALSDSISSVQFCYKKDGESYSTFGPVLTSASGQVQVTGSQVGEQAKYFFKVVLNGVGCTGGTQDETSTSYDVSGPSPVQNYNKEQVSPGFYRLHWKNPGDADFSRVFIYRSESTNFAANSSTKVAEIGGAPDAEMVWDNSGLDGAKTYFYALRAIDKAGNPASIVADPEVGGTVETVTEEEIPGPAVSEPSTLILREREGSVLGEEDEKGQEAELVDADGDEALRQELLGLKTEGEDEGLTGFLTSSPVKSFLKGVGVLLILYGLYKIFFGKKKEII